MAKRASGYPQVRLEAGGLVDALLVPAAPSVDVAAALALVRRKNAAGVSLRARHGDTVVLREDLARAEALGLGQLPAARLVRPLPTVAGDRSEIVVRRSLQQGAPLVVVRGGRETLGGVTAPLARRLEPGASMTARLARALPPALREVLGSVGELGAAHGVRVFLVGGVVRDAWLARAVSSGDVDVVAEGDAVPLARALGLTLGGHVREHPRFLTASVEAPAGRIDLTTARAERYEAPGALPRVIPAGIAQDLARRDFTVNAMAVELTSGAFGLLDPFGGRLDVGRGRLRVLHPLSFVEDPTRIFRAARYGARLGFVEDAWTTKVRALALSLAPYPELSGQRIAAELALIAGEARADVALRRLGAAGVFRLLDGRYRFTGATARWLAALPEGLAWAARRGLDLDPVDLLLLALVGAQPLEVARACLRRLALDGEPLDRILRAREGSGALAAALAASATPSARARGLRGRSGLAVAWLWLTAEARLRARVEAALEGEGRARPALGGEDVVALGVPRGPAVGRVLSEVRDGRLDGAIADRPAEIDYVRSWIEREEGQNVGPPGEPQAVRRPRRAVK